MHTIKSMTPGIIMIIISLVIFSQAYIMEDQSITDPAGGSFFAAIISFIMLISGVVTSVNSVRNKPADPTIETESNDKSEAAEEVFDKKSYGLVFLYFLLIVLYVMILPMITFFPATFLFLLTSIFFLRGISWKMNIAISVGSVIIIYLLFSKLFHIIFP